MNITQFMAENSVLLKRANNGKKSRNRFPDEFKVSVVNAVSKGVSITDLSDVAGVHPTTIRKWLQEKEDIAEPKFYSLPVRGKTDVSSEIEIRIPSGIRIIVPAG